MRLIKITNRNKQNYLDLRGVQPVYEEGEAAYYEKSDQLKRLLEDLQVTRTFYQHPVTKKRH